MVVPEHEAEWPDKAMFAGILLIMAGAIGTLFALLRFTSVTFGENVPVLMQAWPTAIMLPASILTLAMGILATKHQAAVFVYLGGVPGLMSLGAFGLVPLLCLIAVGFMVKAHLEGEDVIMATPTPDADEWPDKALAASLMVFTAGVITLFQGIMTFTGSFAPVLFTDTPAIWASWATLAGLVCFWAAREVYHLRHAWAGVIAGIAGIAGLGFIIVGPVIAATGLVLLSMAGREHEFLDEPLQS